MAAPTTTRPHTDIGFELPTAVAGTLGLLAPATYLAGGMRLGASSLNSVYGCRVNFAAPVNIASREYIIFKLNFENGAGAAFDSLRIYFYDTSGNYSAFLLYAQGQSGTRPNWQDFASSGDSGFFVHFSTVDSTKEIDYTIALDATPVATSGVLNWANLTAFEFYCDRSNSSYSNLRVSLHRMAAIDTPSLVAGEVGNVSRFTIARFISDAVTVPPYRHYRQFQLSPPLWGEAFEGRTFCATHGTLIGDGTANTYFADTKASIAFRPSYNATLRDQYPAIHCSNTTRRKAGVNASATDYVRLTTAIFTGSYVNGGDFDYYMVGNSSADVVLSDIVVYNAGLCQLDIGRMETVTFKACGEVRWTGTTVTGGVITGNTWSGSKGLTINAAPGDYSSLDVYFADNTGGHDIEITPTTAGTYDLSGVSVKDGQSLKIHNNSAIAITVKLGEAYSTVLTGGSITVEYPVVLANASITGLVAGSRVRIYNQTTATELFNGIIAGTSYNVDYPDGTGYTAGDIVSVRIAWMSGASAKLPVEYLTIATVNGWSVLANQQDDAVYNYNAIDGDTVTEFIADYPNVQVDISDPDGVTTVQRAYAWYISGQMTADGLRYYHGALTAEDSVNYRINTDVIDLHAQNLNPDPVYVIGGRLYRVDGQNYAVAGGGGVIAEYGRAYTVQTVGSPIVTGDIADISAALAAIPTNPLLTTDARLDNLDAAISSRLPASSYTAAPTTAQIRTELATELARIDATVSSRLASADYTAPDDTATLSAIAALNDISAGDVLAAATATPIHADLRKAVGVQYHGDGSEANKLRSILVP